MKMCTQQQSVRGTVFFSGAIVSLLLTSCIIKSDRPVVFDETIVSGSELKKFVRIVSDRNGRTISLTEEGGELYVSFCPIDDEGNEQAIASQGQVVISKIPQQNNLYVASLEKDLDLSGTGGIDASEFFLVRLSPQKLYIWSVDPENYPAHNNFSGMTPLEGSNTTLSLFPVEAITSFLVEYSDEYIVANQPYVLENKSWSRLSCSEF